MSFHGIAKFNIDGNEGKERNSFIAVVIVLPDDMVNGEWVPTPKQKRATQIGKLKSDAVHLTNFVYNETSKTSEGMCTTGNRWHRSLF